VRSFAVASLLLLACAREPIVVHDVTTTRVEREQVKIPCLDARSAPTEPCDDSDWPCDEKASGPRKYRVQCGDLPWQECDKIKIAAWSDYGKAAASFIRGAIATCLAASSGR
jgi:hypothetical protein